MGEHGVSTSWAFPVSAFVFDFYGTLAHATEWGPPFDEILGARGYRPDLTTGRPLAPDGCEHAEASATRQAYAAWERSLMAERCQGWGVRADEIDEVVDELLKASKSYALALYPEVPAVLAALRDAGVHLAVCSNWDWDLPDRLADLGIADAFDTVVTSARAGARKAHPSIYRHTLDALGSPDPASVVFVGDTWEPDVTGPLRAGMRPVHLVRDADTRPVPPLPEGAARAEDLWQAVGAVAR